MPSPNRRHAPCAQDTRGVAASLATVALATSLFLAGCGGGGSGSSGYTDQPGWTLRRGQSVYNKKAWTFLVYLNGANNLDPDGVANIRQMAGVGSNDSVNIVIQWKRLTGFNGETRRFYLTHNTDVTAVEAAPLSVNASIDMGKAQSLQDFVQWGVHAFPATHYCVVLWNHGAGWRAQKVLSSAAGPAGRAATTTMATTQTALTRGFSYDDITGSHIDTTELGSAIAIGNGFQWDLVAMDASLMQMAEVAYEIRDQTHYIVASEESPSELGYPYNAMLTDLEVNTSWDGRAFGVDIANKTLAYYSINSNVTQSVLDTSQLSALPAAVDALGSALTAAQPTYGKQIAAARDAAESVSSSSYAGDYRDLTDFANLLTDGKAGISPVTDAGVQNAAQAVKSALAKTIVYNVHGDEHPNMHGLTLFLSAPRRYSEIEQEQASSAGPGGGSLLYTELSFVKAAPNWNTFLAGGPN